VSLKVADSYHPPHSPAKRRPVSIFTESARLRLLKFIARIDWKYYEKAVFITLTYPDDKVLRRSFQRNKDRYLFWRYLETYLGRDACGLWRLEWKQRKSGKYRGIVLPHFHLLAFGVSWVPKEEVRRWWRTILNHEGNLSTHVRGYDSGENAAIYAAKYAAKNELLNTLDYHAQLNIEGRSYGYFRKAKIPLCKKLVLDGLRDGEIKYLMRAAAERLPWVDPRGVEGFTLLGAYATQVAENLQKISLDMGMAGCENIPQQRGTQAAERECHVAR
jgi:hypothetical protein